MLHDVAFHEWQRRPRLVGEDVDRHVEGRVARQQRLQTGVRVAQERLAFDFALVANQGGGPAGSRQRLILFLENQNPRGGGSALELNIFACGQIDKTAGLQTMPSLLEHDAGQAFQDVGKILIDARVAQALALLLQRDEHLGKARAEGRGDENIANRLLPARQVAGDKAAGSEQGVALLNDVAGETEWFGHGKVDSGGVDS